MRRPAPPARALARIDADLAGAVKRGRIDAAERDAVLRPLAAVERSRRWPAAGSSSRRSSRSSTRSSAVRQLEAVLGPDAVLATNTSSISITAVAQGLPRRSA